MLKGKKILLGITGSIAAYKAAILVRALKKEGCEVKVIMTSLAKEFITPLTLATVAQNPILVDFFNPENGEWNSHVKLGIWADAYLIAPATANSMAKMATGVADNLLLTTYLSSRAKVFVAPAMDLDMYQHCTTQRNMKQLLEDGVDIIEPSSGFLASGLEGKGRMEEPENIVAYLKDYFERIECEKPLKGKKALVTAGGTIEPIDAVRFISNYSSGKMGYAVAKALNDKGADVTIIRASVDSNLKGSIEGVYEVEAHSAAAMFEKATQEAANSDIIVMSAAVADYTPVSVSEQKMKKGDFGEALSIELTETKDIAKAIGSELRDDQTFVGFALESNNEEENAAKKLKSKKFDYIVLNSLQNKGTCFGSDSNKVTIFNGKLHKKEVALNSKAKIAEEIVDIIINGL